MRIPQVLRPPLHTLWQAFTATEVAWWAASGHDGVESVHNVSDAKQFAVGAVIAAGAAVASAAYHTAKQYGPGLVNGLLRGHVNSAELVLINDALDAALTHAPAVTVANVEQHFHYPQPERVAVTHPADGTLSPPVDGDPDANPVA